MGSATVSVAPFGVPPNASSRRPNSNGDRTRPQVRFDAPPRRIFLSPSKSPPTCKMYFCETNPTSKYEIHNKINVNLKILCHNDAQNEPKFNRPQPRRCLPIGPIRLIRPIPSFSCSSSPPLPRRSATKTGRILDSIRQYESLLHPKSSGIKRNQSESSVSAKKIQRAQTRQKTQFIGQIRKKHPKKHVKIIAKKRANFALTRTIFLVSRRLCCLNFPA